MWIPTALDQAKGDLGDGLTPSELISSWADQAGYPVINAFQNYDDNPFIITQLSLSKWIFFRFKQTST